MLSRLANDARYLNAQKVFKCTQGISTSKVLQHPKIANEMKPDIIQRCQE